MRSPLLDDDMSTSSYSSVDSTSSLSSFYSRYTRAIWITAAVTLLLVALMTGYGIGWAVHGDHSSPLPPSPSNSTSPTSPNYPSPLTIYISINGFRASYLDQYLPYLPAFRYLLSHGLRAKQMTPVLPSVTYPNHMTLSTGLWPESHGIVSNSMYDPLLNSTFNLGAESEADGRWYEVDPVWVTAKRQGLKTAVQFWAGSDAEINGVRPDVWKKFLGDDDDEWYADEQRLVDMLSWIDSNACNLCMMHLDNMDHVGHGYGPNSSLILPALITYDNWLQRLIDGLDSRHLLSSTHLIVVSDHGMVADVPTKNASFGQFTSVPFTAVDQGAFSALWSHNPTDARQLYTDLSQWQHGQVWLKDGVGNETVPDRYHYRSHRRIAPVLVQSDEAWQIYTRPRSAGNGGAHGFEPELESMQALFVAMGPKVKTKVTMDHLDNINVYELVCASLGIVPNANNGTVGFWAPYLTS